MALPALAAVILKVAGPIIAAKVGQKLTKGETDILSAAIVKEIVTDPILKNEFNAEAPVQSRVAWGASAGGTGALVVVLTELSTKPFPEYDFVILVPAAITVWGCAYALYGRFKAGLKPLFSRK